MKKSTLIISIHIRLLVLMEILNTIYLANVFSKNGKHVKVYIHQIDIDVKNIRVTSYGDGTVTLFDKNSDIVDQNGLYYSPNEGLFIGVYGIGKNILNLNKENYKKMITKACKYYMCALDIFDCDTFEQLESEDPIIYSDQMLHTENVEVSAIWRKKISDGDMKGKSLLGGCGYFSKIAQILEIPVIESNIPITINYCGDLSKGSQANFSTHQPNIRFAHKGIDMGGNNTVKSIAGEIVFSRTHDVTIEVL